MSVKGGLSSLGTGDETKMDEFSEKFQTAFDPPSFSENYIANFFMINMVAYMRRVMIV